MSDNQGSRPESEDSVSEPVAPAASPQPAPASDVPTTPPAAAAPVGPAMPPRPPYPASYPKAPAGYGGPAAATGQAFGPGAQTAPTLPLGGPAPSAPVRKKSAAGRTVGLLVAAALVGGAAGVGGTYAGISMWGQTQTTAASSPTVVTVNDTQKVNNVTAVAAKVLPSVVTISATASNGGGTGSGVVLSADGYVLTNTHVVTLDGATADPTLSVTTSDGKVYKATLVGTDPTYDLAVIKLTDASGLTPIDFADSSKLNVGDQAIALGAPLGLDNTVTTGIVSALNRSIEIASSAAPDDSSTKDDGGQGQQESPFQFDFGQGQQQQQQQSANATIKIAVIQTDAAINPGNSGGALVDSDGKLIGINVAIASSGGSSSGGQSGNIGVGFSIPANIAQRVADEIIKDGSATHGLLGATVADAASQKNATIQGAYIQDVSSGGAAAAAGLRSGDIVTEFNGVPVTNAIDLTAQVRAAAGGSDATLSYVRDGKTETAKLTLGTLQ
ncbi:trypsin-like peptidase domain-containing protein [Microbacterium sp. BG28]|uniref:S1C family serine protease n=1 Tax=Microbacterium sp. BG28 TaxID=3097356 RepID=UPI002A59EA71|nr:trypsin-like peptidase domain-containing protein [Microbacterium sp. BG28]MDY0828867.1 trypsin-like peptidase domain-containing protein [Microbacterium sp. BG28]